MDTGFLGTYRVDRGQTESLPLPDRVILKVLQGHPVVIAFIDSGHEAREDERAFWSKLADDAGLHYVATGCAITIYPILK